MVLFDRRGEVESDGDPNAFGWRGTRDVSAAISYLESRPDVDPDRIGAVGLSVGGEVLLQAAAVTDALQAVVSEGAGVRSVREAVHVPGAVKVIFTEISALSTVGTAIFTSDLPPPGLTDLSAELGSVGGRGEAFPVPSSRGDEARHGGGPDARDQLPKDYKVRDIYIPDLHIDTIKVRGRNFC